MDGCSTKLKFSGSDDQCSSKLGFQATSQIIVSLWPQPFECFYPSPTI